MFTIYQTREWKGYGKQNYCYNEYRLEGNEISLFKCNRQKIFDGRESNWCHDEKKVRSWNVNDKNVPEWLQKVASDYIK